MTPEKLAGYRQLLLEYADRLRRDASSVASQALGQRGGSTDDKSSTVPLEMAELGTETYLQELSATLLEKEEFLVNEVRAALQRIENGSFGQCERCGQPIVKARLDAIPFTRFCAACAATATSDSAAGRT
jgi:RNA polymerase-binding transcription factor DksA